MPLSGGGTQQPAEGADPVGRGGKSALLPLHAYAPSHSVFKAEFVNQYSHRLNERRQFDFLGRTPAEHYQYFVQLCKERVSLKELLELRHYVLRLGRQQGGPGELQWQQWL